jgi:hypothetical protein
LPQQSQNNIVETIEVKPSDLLSSRLNFREAKNWGRYWFSADCIFKSSTSDRQVRVEWGQVIEIQLAKESQDRTMGCWIYALVREKKNQISAKKKVLKTVKDEMLYDPEKFMDELFALIESTKQEAIKKDSELEDFFSWEA